ncbi:DUF1028 domain-containing protein [Pelagibacterium montanilacus]|uniref:DUF1028 domain-containing protein n=1 Tax=Pelagibacterium montanilacus TaxID=2185280 RepID=UPI000F8CD234|nr:DUF1028 domain-containing protein [Pelagibacterium montanilacus]
MTFSIVARDAATGYVGVATATGGPAVGSLVPHARPGLGAIATQGLTNPFLGFDGLEALAEGLSAGEALERVKAADADIAKRQVIIVDRNGGTQGWCGCALGAESGMVLAEGVAVAGNLLADTEVLDAMLAAYQRREGEALEARLLAALGAGEARGGDRRGTRSAALKVYADQPYPRYDVRVDSSDHPIAQLAEVLGEVRIGDYAEFFAQVPRR